MPGKLNLAASDMVVEFLEFHGTAAERLGRSLAEAEEALTRGRSASALYHLRAARTTQALLAKGLGDARDELTATGGSAR